MNYANPAAIGRGCESRATFGIQYSNENSSKKGVAGRLSYLVLISVNCLDRAPKLIGNVQFVGVEEEDDPVDPLGEPLENPHEVVSPVSPLLFAAQDAGGVDHCDAFEDGAVDRGALEAVEKGPSKFGKRPELPLVVHRERVSRYYLHNSVNLVSILSTLHNILMLIPKRLST